MAATPQNADETGPGDRTLAADNGRNGDDVIRVGSMAHPQEKADHQNGQPGRQ
jgi:hypothetical protein